ncbi:lipoprotein insertase outer membrane protein LolB [Caenimonas sp. SL110]|uniref:lipoprotein insertase outer membrane protein LolB n=1 Tax=Caenimonas sp. SL110 TaxID=1450524 RepID=UPI000653B8FE|nr:lipoprotein insertase outer membrane protein LolB [Caenimonas sp. SL110]
MSLALTGRVWLHLAAVLAAALLAGCASPARSTAEPGQSWAGRLALQVTDRPSESFSAGFELRGHSDAGELKLDSPLVGTLGVLSWRPGSATLRSAGQVRQFESIDALVTHVTGSPMPVAALFDWLRGIDSQVPGWRADLSQVAQGRVIARRIEPTPQAELRVVFER